jgi:phosphomevalonate kinase
MLGCVPKWAIACVSHAVQMHGLSVAELLSASAYKEQHRAAMVEWGERQRVADPGFFCRKATEAANGGSACVWIVSDARRRSDMDWFREHYGHVMWTVRVQASDADRIARGFVFTPGIDDAETECGLDDYTHDQVLENDSHGVDSGAYARGYQALLERCRGECK